MIDRPNYFGEAMKRAIRWVDLFAILAGVGLLGVSGCAHYQPKPLDPVAGARRLERRSLTDPGLKSFMEQNRPTPLAVWPMPAWGLEDLTLAAFYFHPDLDIARAGWATARAGQRTAGQRPNPSLNVAPGRNTTTGTPSRGLLTSFLDLTVETSGKRGARQERAYHLAEAARFHIAAVAWQVRSGVRQNLAALFAAREQVRLLQQQQELQNENVRRMEQRQAAGEFSAFQKSQARLLAEQTRLALRDAEWRASEAEIQMASAIGMIREALEGISLSFDQLDEHPAGITLNQARTQALMNSADLLGGLAEYAASEAALRLEIARQYPDVHLGPAYEFDQGDNKWSLGLNLSLPFFNTNQGPIASAEARRTAAAARFNGLQLRVIESVARAMAAYRIALKKHADADAIKTGIAAQVQRVEARLAAGELSGADLVAIRLEMNAASLAHLQAFSQVQKALGALEDALQSPLGLPPAAWQDEPRTHAHADGGG
ncbi:MAG: TolC family protein [Acidobacteriota bacterium]